MAGHSKWKNIQHRKGAQDAKRGKIFTKLIKEITVAVKTGGGDDPDANPRLRTAIQTAKAANMPKDKIEKAIKKAMGGGGENYDEVTFEGYGLDGVAIFIECMTDNKTRTTANVRSYFNKNGGSLGKDGCLQFVFERKGFFQFPLESRDEEELTLELIDVGASDVEVEDGIVTVYSEMTDYGNVSKKLEEMGINPEEAGLQRIPLTTKKLDAEKLKKTLKLIDAMEEDDDVQKVYHNMEFDEEVMNELT